MTSINTFRHVALWLILAFSALNILGCAAVHTSVKKRNLDVQTKLSETIFLEPVAPNKRIIFIDIRNTSDKDLNVAQGIKDRIQSRGYTITDNPDDANYMLQANILKVGKADLRSSNSALQAGFGGALAGAALGASVSNYDRGSVAGAGLLGAAVGVVGDALVDDVLYEMITDIQIRERPLKGEVIVQSQQTHATQGTATTIKQSVSGGDIQWKIYRTRIVSTANKVNLAFDEARPTLVNGLIKSVGGIF